jgi:hypothetical protein
MFVTPKIQGFTANPNSGGGGQNSAAKKNVARNFAPHLWELHTLDGSSTERYSYFTKIGLAVKNNG